MMCSAGDQKKAFFLLARRWHPDKFMQAFGAQLHPEERSAVEEKVYRMHLLALH